jgi:hypothetical protein
MNLDLLENKDTDLTEFYKVNWISPFNDKDERYVEPGITAINKLYKKVIYEQHPYVVSNKTYEKLSYLQEYTELTTINFNLTNTAEYISKPKLQNIKSKVLNRMQLATIYLYQSDFYYKYWSEQTRQIALHKKSDIQSTYIYLEKYKYFIEIISVDNHKIIIAFNENSYKIIIFKGNIKICDSIYSIKWTFKFNIVNENEDIRKYIKEVVENQKYYLEQFYYYAADFSYPKLNKYKNFKRVSGQSEQLEQNICNIPSKFAGSFKYYYNDRSKYIIAKNDLAKYIHKKTKKQPSIKYYKFNTDESNPNEIFEPEPSVVYYRGMNLPTETTEILHERPFISITRNKMIAMGFMEMDRQLQDGISHILYEITLEKGVPFIDFKILGQDTLYFEEELLLLTEPCVFEYERKVSQNTENGRKYYICKVSISAKEIVQYKFKNIPDIQRFKELKLDISSLSDEVKELTALDNKSSSFNISSSTSSINSKYKSLNNVVMQSSEPKSNIQYETTNVILEHTTDTTKQYVIYKRTDVKDESVYICIDNTYYEVSGKITDETKKIINKKITYKIITDKSYRNKNYFLYLNKYSPACKKLKLIKFTIIFNNAPSSPQSNPQSSPSR